LCFCKKYLALYLLLPVASILVSRALYEFSFLPFRYLSRRHYKNEKFVEKTPNMRIQDFKRRLLRILRFVGHTRYGVGWQKKNPACFCCCGCIGQVIVCNIRWSTNTDTYTKHDNDTLILIII
jgi:hypothetical protein